MAYIMKTDGGDTIYTTYTYNKLIEQMLWNDELRWYSTLRLNSKSLFFILFDE